MPSESQIDPSRRRYTVIPRILIFLQQRGKVLLIKGAPDKKLWPKLYNGIGGHVEPGETVQQAAMRELLEETGITQATLTLRGMVSIQLPSPQDGMILFIFSGDTQSKHLSHSSEGRIKWFNWDELPTDQLVEDLPTILPLIRNATPEQAPFYALYTYDNTGSLNISFT